MFQRHSGYLVLKFDPSLSAEFKRRVEGFFPEGRRPEPVTRADRLVVEFVSEASIPGVKRSPGKVLIGIIGSDLGLFSFGQDLERSPVDALLDENLDATQLNRILGPHLSALMETVEARLWGTSIKNLRKFEAAVRSLKLDGLELAKLGPEKLLSYAQELVDLEKELIQAEDLGRMEKVLRQFAKISLSPSGFKLSGPENLWRLDLSDRLLPLPALDGNFLALELQWSDADLFSFLKKVFFYQTLVSFLRSRSSIGDPFFNERLWDSVLDGVPFPLALISSSGEVHQHNGMFSKLNFPPSDCLKLSLREKVSIGDIPFNVFRKAVHHLGEEKHLFVFFTESFFLRGDGNLTPTGQELGIISSSIAHELNNPIAGIQAALSLLALDDDLEEEAQQTLEEMKSGADRCKQLVETFLGFSRLNPMGKEAASKGFSNIGICYQQAQNLLRFRTVESGIRFQFDYSKHADFRAEVNTSLLTMTFYLILGELMTLYSHQLLIANRSQIEKIIKGEIIESAQEIQVQLLELNISTLGLSKLIQNLLHIENLVLQVSDYSLRFIHSPATDA